MTIAHARHEEDSELEITKTLEQLDCMLGSYEPLTGDEVRRRSRLGKGLEAVVDDIAELCRQSCLYDGGFTLDEMLSSHRQLIIARRQLEALDLIRARLDARRVRAESEVALRFSFFYRLVQNLARFDETVRVRFEALVARAEEGRRKRRRSGQG